MSMSAEVETTPSPQGMPEPAVNGVAGEPGQQGEDEFPSWLDKEFVQQVLRRDRGDDRLAVLGMTVERAVPVGDNYASVLLRVHVDYREGPDTTDTEDGQLSLIVKSVPHGEIMQKWINEMAVFLREAHIYEVTLPALHRLMSERTGSACEQLCTRVYAHDRPQTIVLADLKPLGYRMGDRRRGLDLQHSKLALRTLARLHGMSVALHEQDPTCMDFYYERMFSEDMRKMQTDLMSNVFKNLATEVKSWPGYERFEEKLLNKGVDCVDKVMELVKPGAIRVLNHGDFWTNNMLFRYDDEGQAVDVKMVDFQMVRFASPALDIQYFLHTSPSQQILEDNYEELLEAYHGSLCETMERAGCSPHLRISMDQLRKEMKEKEFFALFISSLFSIMVAEPEDAPDFSKVTEKDVEDGKMDTMNKAMAGWRFRAAFQRRLVKFESQGLL